MRISFCPQRCDDAIEVHKQVDVLTINGEEFDFSDLPNGAVIEGDTIGSAHFAGPVQRVEGVIALTLRLPYRIGNRHVEAPADLIDPPDGVLTLPNLDLDPETEVEENDDVQG